MLFSPDKHLLHIYYWLQGFFSNQLNKYLKKLLKVSFFLSSVAYLMILTPRMDDFLCLALILKTIFSHKEKMILKK